MIFARALYAFVFLFGAIDGLSAAEVKIATSQPDDGYITSLRSSPYLKEVGVNVTVIKVAADDDAFNLVFKGAAELGLFELKVFSNRKFDKQPELFSVFTRPFLFRSVTELLDIQSTPVGGAVLADIRSVGILPLGFWNKGFSQIWTRQPVNTVEHLKGLTVGENSDRPANREREMIFTSLGVKSTKAPGAAMAEAFGKGRLNGYVWESAELKESNWQHYSYGFTVYATEFQPRVGIIAAAQEYWNSLSEAHKLALKQAVDEAERAANGQLVAAETPVRRNPSIVFVSHPDEGRALAASAANSDQSTARLLTQDLQLVGEARAYISASSGKPNDSSLKKSRIDG
jgi:Bacterial extracellular solute-binding protein, family 7